MWWIWSEVLWHSSNGSQCFVLELLDDVIKNTYANNFSDMVVVYWAIYVLFLINFFGKYDLFAFFCQSSLLSNVDWYAVWLVLLINFGSNWGGINLIISRNFSAACTISSRLVESFTDFARLVCRILCFFFKALTWSLNTKPTETSCISTVSGHMSALKKNIS